MGKPEKKSIYEHVFILFRRCLVLLIIAAVAALALFWESLPASVKNAVSSLSSEHSEVNDDLIPTRFRAEKNTDNLDNILRQSSQIPQFSSQPCLFDHEKRPLESGVTVGSEIKNSPIDNDLFVQLYNELQKMGATACQLTYWGDKGNVYRFTCQVPVSEHRPNATRTFQSIAPDAAQSMQEVVDQVRKWQLGQ